MARILIVEDDENLRLLEKMALSAAGFKVVEGVHPEAADVLGDQGPGGYNTDL